MHRQTQRPRRTSPGITPPAAVKEADRVVEEFQALGSKIEGDHPIGRYHSFFYDMLTWKYPRASGLILATLLTTLIVSKSVNLPKLAFRALWVVLASTTSLELAGQFVFRSNEGLVAKFAPKQLITLDRARVDPVFDELFSLTNFFLTEAQRLLFVKNAKHTTVAFVLSFVAYNLIKFLPLSALIGIAILLAFSMPPVYLRHRQVIDAQLAKAQEVSTQHYEQVKSAASKQAGVASDRARSVAIDLGNKVGVNVHQYIGGPGPVMSESVHAELAKQPKEASKKQSPSENKMTTAPTEAISAFTSKVPESAPSVGGADAAPIPKTTVSPPVEEHVKDSASHDDYVKPAESVQNKDAIPI
ncbi:Reticulon-domain-containing protein [Protomyces lactucae-debilis]|uniref:Reticulon-like protein n=1 Tax=Protomyces lactucae-debilis TaxID=2754530 RepID=A0A1Y2F1N1_PROLT|nr:Reticulon-domain-containing protein [Protomyces lactucae-debilis]ORY77802.1 Reticulon-domain-containing protein [Protomyces lactucae-debilis]